MTQFTPSEVLDEVRSVGLLTLAVCGKDNQPQSHMLVFSISDDFNIFIVTPKKSNKHKTLSENNKVGVSIWKSNTIFVQILAQANEVFGNEAQLAIDAIAKVAANLPNFWSPLAQMASPHGYAAFKLKPSSIRALDLKNKSITNSKQMFTNIKAQL